MGLQNSTMARRGADDSVAGNPADADLDRGKDEPLRASVDRDSPVVQIARQVLELIQQRKTTPRATYRCQFHNGFGFREASSIVPYLSALGISHLYASPVWHARPGSAHGYDVCNHQEFDPELGGEAGWNELQATLRQFDMGLLLDIVPNHMSTHGDNAWWTDVLENGPGSPYAKFFDIDWEPAKQELDGHVLLPGLGRQYGDALEAGELSVAYESGGLFLRYFDRWLPLDPRTAPLVLARNLDDLRATLANSSDVLAEYENILAALEHLPPRTATSPEQVTERQRDKQVIKRRLRELVNHSPAVREFIDRNVAQINGVPGEAASYDALDELCTAQVYRLCNWKAAGDEVNYRRFFDINELAALCIEDPDAFYQTHRLVLRLVAEGSAVGLRVDHIDGLFAPEQYLWRLQWGYLAELVNRAIENVPPAQDKPAHAASNDGVAVPAIIELCRQLGIPRPRGDDWRAILGRTVDDVTADEGQEPPPEVAAAEARDACVVPLFVVVEKILGPHEPLPETWPVAGTTGYDFLQMSEGLLLPDDGWRQLKRDYARIIGDPTPFEKVAQDSKKLILSVAMAGELQMLAHRLNRISEQHRRSRDFTLNMLRLALREILVCFPIYRIYPGTWGVSDRDRHFVAVAVAMAKRRNPAIDASVFDFVRDVLLLEHPPGLSAEAIRERELFAGRFQQVTSPVMAKGVEDTAFYVYGPLLSMNEVGNKPEAPVVRPSEFHAWNEQRAKHYPHAMLASSTHDTKRSEDVRARLSVLAEVPGPWRKAVQRWMRFNRRRRLEIDGLPAPSRRDEYHIYQTLVGVWPFNDDGALEELTQRMCRYMDKAGHEAKERTSWINPNEAYDRAMHDFVTAVLEPRKENRFLADLRAWQRPVAALGLVNSLAELVLKLTSPGFPDIYQGQECWAFRLVDPDNREPVDFGAYQKLLKELQQTAAEPTGLRGLAQKVSADLANPRTKLFVTWRLLELRRRFEELFNHSHHYLPLNVSGDKAEHVVAFARLAESQAANSSHAVVVVIPRLIARLLGFDADAKTARHVPWDAAAWGDTTIELPSSIAGSFTDIFTGAGRELSAAAAVSDVLQDFPVAVLARP
jgi:(1->4)-alpha-D-glucan 1-alpha-D-glucosylmutase